MSIRVEVRKETGEAVGPAAIHYHRIVGWSERHRFPMLGFTNATGDLILNSLQVVELETELTTIRDLCGNIGPTAALAHLGAPFEPDDFTVPGWDPERDLLPMLAALRRMCQAVQEGEHRYLWFVGD